MGLKSRSWVARVLPRPKMGPNLGPQIGPEIGPNRPPNIATATPAPAGPPPDQSQPLTRTVEVAETGEIVVGASPLVGEALQDPEQYWNVRILRRGFLPFPENHVNFSKDFVFNCWFKPI